MTTLYLHLAKAACSGYPVDCKRLNVTMEMVKCVEDFAIECCAFYVPALKQHVKKQFETANDAGPGLEMRIDSGGINTTTGLIPFQPYAGLIAIGVAAFRQFGSTQMPNQILIQL